MNCKKCGSPLGPNEVFCKECGTSVDTLVPGTPGITPSANQQQAPVTPVTPVAPVATPVAAPVTPTGVPSMPSPMMGQSVGNASVPPVSQMSGVPMQQPPVKEKKGGSKFIVAIVAILAIAVVAAVLYFTVFNKKEDKKPESNSNTTSQSNTNSANNSNTNSNSNVVQNNTFSINHGGYTFKIPLQYKTQVQGENLVITDDVNWAVAVQPLATSYESLLAQKETLKQNLISSGYTNVTDTEETVNGKSYFVIKETANGQNGIIGFVKADAASVFLYELITSDNTYGTKYLSVLDSIFGTAVADNNGFGIDVSGKDLKSIFMK